MCDEPGVCIWAAGMQGFESADMQGRLPRVEAQHREGVACGMRQQSPWWDSRRKGRLLL